MTDCHFGPGADNQTAPAAGDQLFGGDGADTLNAVAGGNRLVGDAGDDVLNGAAGNDTLKGGSDPNIIEHNVLNGFGGDDQIISGSWGDQIAAGDGNDVVQVTAMRTGQTVDGGADDHVLFLVALSEVSQNLSVRMGSTFQPVVGGIAGATYFNF